MMPHWDGPGAANAALPEVEDDGDDGLIASAAIPTRSWRGSSSIFGGFTSKSSSTTNSAELIDEETSRLIVMRGARGRRTSASRVIRGGRRDVVDRGGAEQ